MPWAIEHTDLAILAALAQWRAPLLEGLFGALTWLGSLWLLLPIALAHAGIGWWRGRTGKALWPLAALLAASLLCHLLKLLCMRPRPTLTEPLIAMPADFAFPSAHAAQAAALALALGWRLPAAWRLLLGLLVLGVAVSRLYLQVHYPSDVLAGLVLGALCALGAAQLCGEAPGRR